MKLFSNPMLFAFAIILAVASFLMFHIMLAQTVSPVVVEIAAAVLGTLLTITVTGILLNTQTEVELNKESNIKILETKIALYTALMDKIGAVLEKETVSKQDIISIQLLNQKIAFVACKQVLNKFSAFTDEFAKSAKDGKLDTDEINKLLDILAGMSFEISLDLATEQEKKRLQNEEGEIIALIKKNMENLSKTKIDQNQFLEACSPEEQTYFGAILDHIKNRDAQFNMGVTGFSILNIDGNRVALCYPTNSRRNIEIEIDRFDEKSQNMALDLLLRNGIRRDPAKKRVTFKSSELPAAEFCNLLDQLCVGRGEAEC